MYAQKIVYENRNQYKRIDVARRYGDIIFFANFAHRLFRFVRRERRKQYAFPAVFGNRDVVLHVFELSADALPGMAIQYFVKLQDIICRYRDIVKIFVNDVKRVAIPRDFFFIAVFRRRFVVAQLFQPCCGRPYSISLDDSVLWIFAISTSFSRLSG